MIDLNVRYRWIINIYCLLNPRDTDNSYNKKGIRELRISYYCIIIDEIKYDLYDDNDDKIIAYGNGTCRFGSYRTVRKSLLINRRLLKIILGNS